jgi:hypothetical protein
MLAYDEYSNVVSSQTLYSVINPNVDKEGKMLPRTNLISANS